MRLRQSIVFGIVFCQVLSSCNQAANQSVAMTPTLIPTQAALPTWTPSPAPQPSPTRSNQTGRDAAAFIGENFPDYSVIAPGEHFLKTWDIKNIGATTWYVDSYILKLSSASNNEMMGSPIEVKFPHDIAPGEAVTIAIPMVAPSKPGIYAVYFSPVNDRKQVFDVDGDKLWVLINVFETGMTCIPRPTTATIATNGATAAQSGISARLSNFVSNNLNSTAAFCLTLPDRTYGPANASVNLILDGRPVLAATGGSLDVGCFEFEFPVTDAEIAQATEVAVSINQVRLLGGIAYPQAACESARILLIAQYPGLDFNCSFSPAGYYTDLKLPEGISSTQADALIVDGIEGAINGPWILKVK